jgi:hypothetical protein
MSTRSRPEWCDSIVGHDCVCSLPKQRPMEPGNPPLFGKCDATVRRDFMHDGIRIYIKAQLGKPGATGAIGILGDVVCAPPMTRGGLAAGWALDLRLRSYGFRGDGLVDWRRGAAAGKLIWVGGSGCGRMAGVWGWFGAEELFLVGGELFNSMVGGRLLATFAFWPSWPSWPPSELGGAGSINVWDCVPF